MDPGRRRPSHLPSVERHNAPIVVLLTVCTKDRKPILAKFDAVAALCAAWREAQSWDVGRFVVMPDHIHLFCSPAEFPPRGIGQWVRYWKAIASRKWPRPVEQPIWQADFWDRQLRHGEHYSERWEYVRQNPVRAGLVQHPHEWPWQGEQTLLRW
jgi:putative transposase